MQFSQYQYRAAGIDHILSESVRYPMTMLLFFVIMSFTLMRLAVVPSINEGAPKKAYFRGFLIGITAYGTLALANTWSIADFPLSLTGEIMLEGILFAPISAGMTAQIYRNN